MQTTSVHTFLPHLKVIHSVAWEFSEGSPGENWEDDSPLKLIYSNSLCYSLLRRYKAPTTCKQRDETKGGRRTLKSSFRRSKERERETDWGAASRFHIFAPNDAIPRAAIQPRVLRALGYSTLKAFFQFCFFFYREITYLDTLAAMRK